MSVSRSNPLPGTVKARREATISSKLPGTILFLQGEVGDTLSAGSIVAEIDVESIRAQVNQAQAGRDSAQAQVGQAQAALAQAQAGLRRTQEQIPLLERKRSEIEARRRLAKSDFERFRYLAQEGAVPQQQAQRAETDFRVAQAQMEQLESQIRAAQLAIQEGRAGVIQALRGIERNQAGVSEAEAGIQVRASDLGYSQVRAPFRGFVVEKFANQGEINLPGRPILKIQDLASLEVVVSVPEALVDRIRIGGEHVVECPALGQNLPTKVRQIVTSSDPASRTFEVRLRLLKDHPQLFPGMYVRLNLPEAPHQAVVVAKKGIVQRGQLEGVFVVSDGQTAQFRIVQPGATHGQEVEVLAGLEGGEKVVLSPPEALQDGRKVQSK